MNLTDICSSKNTSSNTEIHNNSGNIINKFFLIGIILIFIILIICCCYCCKQNIKFFVYKNSCCKWHCYLEEDEENASEGERYDAFISYSHKDEPFVNNELVPKLEQESKVTVKLCLHTRDWNPGEWIYDQIYNSVNCSRRTVIVLSDNYLLSEWSLTEFRVAHTIASQRKRQWVIVILYSINIEDIMDKIHRSL